jgi:hypothetical protein
MQNKISQHLWLCTRSTSVLPDLRRCQARWPAHIGEHAMHCKFCFRCITTPLKRIA